MDASKLRLPLRFFVYLAVATVVGAITIALREGLGYAFGDTPWRYALTVVIAYCVGILLSFEFQGRFTFSDRQRDATRQRLGQFIAIAIISAHLTALVAWTLREYARFDFVFGRFSAALAFAAAALLVAALSYSANARYVFVDHARTRHAAE